MRCDPAPGSLSGLARNQQKAFMKSQDKFVASRYADALGELRVLLAQMPPNTPAYVAMAERTAEAALFAGDRDYVMTLLKPIEEHDASDCPARTLLARAYAENGQSAERDSEINALTALHMQAPKSPAGLLDLFLLEQHSLQIGGRVEIWHCLRPFGPHNAHLVSMFFDASGNPIFRIELSTDDSDQVDFKELHPDLAAKGERRYSLDGYEPDSTEPNGERNAVIRFYEGEPRYDTVRELILAVAKSTEKPVDFTYRIRRDYFAPR